jgi:hypothetical protein
LAEALTLLDRIYATWCTDNTGNDLVNALDPLMEDAKRFLEVHPANAPRERCAVAHTLDGVVGHSDSEGGRE